MTAPHPHQYRFPLGCVLRDLITGFTGTATAVMTELSGREQYCLQPNATADGASLPAPAWCDATMLQQIAQVAPGVSVLAELERREREKADDFRRDRFRMDRAQIERRAAERRAEREAARQSGEVEPE
jgi:hypothetical protein